MGGSWDWLYNPVAIPRDQLKSIGIGGDKTEAPSSPLPVPQAPDVAKGADAADQNVNKRRAMASQTVYTSPLGISGQANIAKKTLLGE